MADATTTPNSAGVPDNLFSGSMARLNEIGNDAILRSNENANRLSAMFGVRAAQANPIEASAISSLKAAESGQDAQSNSVAAMLMTLVSALSNLAHVTPATQGTKPA